MRITVVLCSLTLGLIAGTGQNPHPILKRWVGTVPRTAAVLHLDFFGDSMLLVNDDKALSFSVDGDSLMAWGDTTFTVRFWFSMDRLLVLTDEGDLVTMSEQDRMARPIWGLWRGSPIGRSDERVELWMYRGGTAQYRQLPGGQWQAGEWNRASRALTFKWEVDSTEWQGQYDAQGSTLQFVFDSTFAQPGTLFLRKTYRR